MSGIAFVLGRRWLVVVVLVSALAVSLTPSVLAPSAAADETVPEDGWSEPSVPGQGEPEVPVLPETELPTDEVPVEVVAPPAGSEAIVVDPELVDEAVLESAVAQVTDPAGEVALLFVPGTAAFKAVKGAKTAHGAFAGGAANAGSKLLPKVDNAFQFPGAGRSGAGVKNFVGPPNTVARGASRGESSSLMSRGG